MISLHNNKLTYNEEEEDSVAYAQICCCELCRLGETLYQDFYAYRVFSFARLNHIHIIKPVLIET